MWAHERFLLLGHGRPLRLRLLHVLAATGRHVEGRRVEGRRVEGGEGARGTVVRGAIRNVLDADRASVHPGAHMLLHDRLAVAGHQDPSPEREHGKQLRVLGARAP